MVFAGMNFGLWYELFFERNWKLVIRNRELQVFLGLIVMVTMGIVRARKMDGSTLALADMFRWAFFSVTSIISTTGLANYDFSLWPASAIGLLLIVYFTGSCV